MHIQHELSLDDIFFCSESFCILDNDLPVTAVSVDEICNVFYCSLDTLSLTVDDCVLCGNEDVRHLLAQVGNKIGPLHDFERSCSAMFFF